MLAVEVATILLGLPIKAVGRAMAGLLKGVAKEAATAGASRAGS